MDPTALIAGLQQSGAQFTPAQIQQIQNQLQQQQNAHQQNTSNVSTGNNTLPNAPDNNGQAPSNTANPNSQITNNNLATFFQGQAPPMQATQQVAIPAGNGNNVNQNAAADISAFPFALLGASPLQQQLAAISGFPQQQATQAVADTNALQKQQQQQQQQQTQQQQVNANPQPQQQQQQQQMQTWNPQFLQQFSGINPFMTTPGLMVPAPMNMQHLQQQFLAQQMMTQQLAAGQNAAAGGFNHLLAALLAQSGGVMNQPAALPTGAMSGFPFAPVQAPQQHQTSSNDAMMNSTGIKVSANPGDGPKVGGEVEWTKPFAARVKKEAPFPLKLYQILNNPECQECICWNPHGRSWRILKPPVFEQVVIPLYFRFVLCVAVYNINFFRCTLTLTFPNICTDTQSTHPLCAK
jgi:HSF-type DNA-binding